jgi:hypothetical protein
MGMVAIAATHPPVATHHDHPTQRQINGKAAFRSETKKLEKTKNNETKTCVLGNHVQVHQASETGIIQKRGNQIVPQTCSEFVVTHPLGPKYL